MLIYNRSKDKNYIIKSFIDISTILNIFIANIHIKNHNIEFT